MYFNVSQFIISTAGIFGIAALWFKISETAFYTAWDLMDAPFIKNYYSPVESEEPGSDMDPEIIFA